METIAGDTNAHMRAGTPENTPSSIFTFPPKKKIFKKELYTQKHKFVLAVIPIKNQTPPNVILCLQRS